MNIQTALIRCIETASATRAAGTADTYKCGVDLFELMLSEDRNVRADDVSAVNMQDFTRFPVWLRKRGLAKSTTLVYVAAAKWFMDWMVINNYLSPDYADTLRYQQAVTQIIRLRESKLPRFPEREHVAQMKAAVRLLPYKPVIRERNIAMIEFLSCTGCRVSEMANLSLAEFSPDYSSAIVTGKGSKERRAFLSTSAVELLLAYWKARGGELTPTMPAFSRHDKGAGKRLSKITTCAVRHMVEEVSMMAGIENFTPHYFRHAFAIRVLAETGNLALTQDLLGHETPASTRVYAKIYPDDMRKAHGQIFNS